MVHELLLGNVKSKIASFDARKYVKVTDDEPQPGPH